MVESDIGRAIEAAKAARLFDHRGLKGRAREIFITNLLEPFLYPTMGICTGIVVDSLDHQSKQIDVIIYDKQVVPPILMKEGEGIIPCESVLASIEIKSQLTRDELRNGILNAISIKQLQPHPSCVPVDCNLQPLSQTFHLPSGVIFAFDSDLSGTDLTELDRINDIIQEIGWTDPNPPIAELCVAERICYNWGKTLGETRDTWKTTPHNEHYEEIINFIMGVINSCRTTSITRGKAYFGTYVVD
jgi:hypothetical protein